jgi:hypothetical protein
LSCISGAVDADRDADLFGRQKSMISSVSSVAFVVRLKVMVRPWAVA